MATVAQYAPAIQTNVSGTSAITILAASGNATGYRDLVSITITTVNAVAGTVTVSDGGKNVLVINYPNAASAPSTPLQLYFDPPLEQSKANSAWTATASANASGYNITAQYLDR
jgi:hypothetical protein